MSSEEVKIEFSRLVNRGIVLGSVWIFGIGSVIAIISGYQAGRLLKESGIKTESSSKIQKCYLIGALGILIDLAVVLIIVFFRKK
ncbi:MAG TPA: hypothetical protein PK536_13385 [Ignavibacteria bacterium]|nr:hypothetical protein [Bacteroidota bacterium]HRI86430.1 hypothetical protein [Ignavibacteria bacterium]HRK00354.1 hypothetical protein [Ignavibacteria bacterium]